MTPALAAPARRASLVAGQLRAAGLAPLRTAVEPEGVTFLLCGEPARWLEVRVDRETGLVTAHLRCDQYPDGVVASLSSWPFAALRDFVTRGKFPLDSA